MCGETEIQTFCRLALTLTDWLNNWLPDDGQNWLESDRDARDSYFHVQYSRRSQRYLWVLLGIEC